MSTESKPMKGVRDQVKGLSKEKRERLMDTDNRAVIARGTGVGRGRRG